MVGFHGSGGRVMWGADAFREFYPPQVDVEQAEQLLGLPAGTSALAADKDGNLVTAIPTTAGP